MTHPSRVVAFQGVHGAYSEQACRERLFDYQTLPCKTFEDLFVMVEEGHAHLGMVPVENSMAGVVSDSYDLLAVHNLSIVGEHYVKVRHCLMAHQGVTMAQLKTVYSHPQALAQCNSFLKERGLGRMAVYDTAGAAASLADEGREGDAAIASELAAELYGLDVLARNIQDSRNNTTRFLIIAKDAVVPPPEAQCKTSLLFEVRNIPAALYKCLGGFATNGINLTRLESRPVPGRDWCYHFYLDLQGRVDDKPVQMALDELNYFTDSLKVLGCYSESKRPQLQQPEPEA
uniref:Prephenate dehydratase n=1 Tax=Magnetococcus massalia (strain MO-1) TaxID=451514 RepID=A0A1S7LF11_MAGMO|nr:putative Prephenate dehydratase [Candidatus Magnetococcus massalia]